MSVVNLADHTFRARSVRRSSRIPVLLLSCYAFYTEAHNIAQECKCKPKQVRISYKCIAYILGNQTLVGM